MCKRNSPNKNEASAGYVRDTPLIKKKERKQFGICKTNCLYIYKIKIKRKHGILKRNSLHKNQASTGSVRETPCIKRRQHGTLPTLNKVSIVCVRETPHIKMQPAWDV